MRCSLCARIRVWMGLGARVAEQAVIDQAYTADVATAEALGGPTGATLSTDAGEERAAHPHSPIWRLVCVLLTIIMDPVGTVRFVLGKLRLGAPHDFGNHCANAINPAVPSADVPLDKVQ